MMAPLNYQVTQTIDAAAAMRGSMGLALKNEGMRKARKRAGSPWLATTLTLFKEFCLEAYIAGKPTVTTEDFRKLNVAPEPKSDNAWGSLPAAACKAGFLAKTSMTTVATRPFAHGRVVRLWHINPEAL